MMVQIDRPGEQWHGTEDGQKDGLCRLAEAYRVRTLVVDDVEDKREVLSVLLGAPESKSA